MEHQQRPTTLILMLFISPAFQIWKGTRTLHPAKCYLPVTTMAVARFSMKIVFLNEICVVMWFKCDWHSVRLRFVRRIWSRSRASIYRCCCIGWGSVVFILMHSLVRRPMNMQYHFNIYLLCSINSFTSTYIYTSAFTFDSMRRLFL